ncbi:MAG: GNAT family N-acetyltransferase, partial [Chloroflexota bacterium]
MNSKLPDGFTARPPSFSDIKALNELLNLTSIEMVGLPENSESGLESHFKRPGIDIENNSLLIISSDDQLVGFVNCLANPNLPAYPSIFGRVHPNYRNLGLGSYMLDWAINRGKHVLEKVPGDIKVAVQVVNPSDWEPGKSLLESAGLQTVRYGFDMRIDMTEIPKEPVWPEGILMRQYKHPEDMAITFKTVYTAFEDHYGHIANITWEEELENFTYRWTNDEEFDPAIWYLAYEGKEIVGICLCRSTDREDKYAGYIASIGVLPPWRKRGIGKAFLQHSFRQFWLRGKKSVCLGVDGENISGAVRLYEKAGMYISR